MATGFTMSPSLFILLVFVLRAHSAEAACEKTKLSPDILSIWRRLAALEKDIEEDLRKVQLKDFTIRLDSRRGEDGKGRLVVTINGAVGRLCFSQTSWNKRTADVACRSLGWSHGSKNIRTEVTNSRYKFPYTFKCDGWERTLAECQVIPIARTCVPVEVFIECANTRVTEPEKRNKCLCDCKMRGPKGRQGKEGRIIHGTPGTKGIKGEKGERGKRYQGPPIDPTGPVDPDFVDKVKKRWKGYNGPWGSRGDKGQPGETITCNCDTIRSSCNEWCAPVKGEKGEMGRGGIPGRPGLPGPKGAIGPPLPDGIREPPFRGRP